jgi:hypothetical protein
MHLRSASFHGSGDVFTMENVRRPIPRPTNPNQIPLKISLKISLKKNLFAII